MRVPKPWIWLFTLIVGARMLPTVWRRSVKKIKGRKPDRFEQSAPRRIPKIIWIYWDSGEDNAPELIRHCIASWRDRNPGWDVRLLNQRTAAQIVNLPYGPSEIQVQSYADLLRLRLLRQYGGVWADATTYCLKPLDDWLPPLAQRGFFAFTWTRNDYWFIWPGMRRSLTNWFLASEPEGGFISRWEEACFDYWEGRTKPHTYYWPHVMIDYLYLTSRSFRYMFGEIPKISCYGAHLAHDCATRGRNTREVAALLSTGVAPVQKLRWNWDDDRIAIVKTLLEVDQKERQASGS